MDETDYQLLKRFAKMGDHIAFEVLVKKFADIAYSAAISCLQREDLAKDACQLTFLTLSRKAALLNSETQLGGWVYVTARNISKSIQRSELRRKKREIHYSENMRDEPKTDDDCSSLTPEIHRAIEQLKTQDRDAILLRFFQNKNLAQIGETLGLSEDAARMRLKRALSRLNATLARSGITSTSALLASEIPSYALLAAPSGLAASVSAAVMASTGTVGLGSTLLGISIFYIMKKTTILIIGFVFLITIGGTYYFTQSSAKNGTHERKVLKLSNRASNLDEGENDFRSIQDSTLLETESATLSNDTQSEKIIIDPQFLRRAEKMLSMFEIAHETELSKFAKERMLEATSSDLVAKRLTLRLQLSEDQAEILEKILSENEDARRSHPILGDTNKLAEGLLGIDRDKAVEYLALGQMMGDKSRRTPELEAYTNTVEETIFRQLGLDPKILETKPPKSWDKNDEMLHQINQVLNPAQQDDLSVYLADEAGRKLEAEAYRRAMKISRKLGLDETDRENLFDYLQQNPRASDEDLKEIMHPEVHDLFEE